MKYLVLIILFSAPVFAEEMNPLELQDMDIRSARKFYLGGVDEEDISVKGDFIAPYRVINLKMVQQKVRDNLLKAVNETDSEADGDSDKKATQ